MVLLRTVFNETIDGPLNSIAEFDIIITYSYFIDT